jgi:hypothetical protein
MISGRSMRTAGGFALLTVAVFGCDGSSSPTVDAGGGERPTGTVQADGSTAPVDTRITTTDLPPFEAAAMLPPPPQPGASSRKLVGGRARLVGDHLSACSSQPATGPVDRWCAFTLPGRALGGTDLWVLNVTKAMVENIPCDGTNANCKRLTEKLWTGQPANGPTYPGAHVFDGDTLIYHADAPSTIVDIYEGPIYAWRPGMDTGRQITGSKGVTCSGHFRTDVVVCIEDIVIVADQIDTLALHAARLTGTTGRLPKVTTIVPTRPMTQSSQWRAGFNRAGDYFSYSTGGKLTSELETLHVVATADLGMAGKDVTIGPNISRWEIAVDGKKIYYLKDFNYDPDAPTGNLMAADYPSGANAKVLAPDVGIFRLLFDGTDTDRGLSFYDKIAVGKGTFKLMRDTSGATPAVTKVVENVTGALLSRDLRYAMYSTTVNDQFGTTDALLTRTDGSGGCTLVTTDTTAGYGSAFPPGAGQVFWADNLDPLEDVGEGWTANPTNCSGKRKFADGIDYWFMAGNKGMLFSDSGLGNDATLRYTVFDNGGAGFGAPVEIQKRMQRFFTVTSEFDLALFAIEALTSYDGLYGYKLPFAPITP